MFLVRLLFSAVVVPCAISAGRCEASSCFVVSATPCMNRAVAHRGFKFISLMFGDAEPLSCAHLPYSFINYLFKILAHLKKSMVYLLNIELSEFFTYSGYRSFIRYICYKYFCQSVLLFRFPIIASFREQTFFILRKSNL